MTSSSSFFQIGHLDQSDVRVCSLAMVNDLLMWHGLPSFITQEKEFREADEMSNIDSLLESELSDTTSYKEGHRLTQAELNTQGGNSVVAILSKLLDDQDLEIRTKVAEGLCKLLMIGSISSAKLFQRLILMWYNPLAESDGKLRHILGTFFPLYASMSRMNQVWQETTKYFSSCLPTKLLLLCLFFCRIASRKLSCPL